MSIKLKNKILFVFALIVAISASAQIDIYENSYIQLKQNNLELIALEAVSRAEILEMMGENTLTNPEIEFDRLWGRNAEPRWGLNVSQSFSFPSIYKTRKNERLAMKSAKRYEYEVNYIDYKLQVTEMLVSLSYLNRADRLQQQVIMDMERLENLLEKSFHAGESTIIDYNKARIERTNAILARENLEKERDEILAQLHVFGINLDVNQIQEVDYPLFVLKSKAEYLNNLIDDPTVNYYESLKKSRLLQAKVGRLERLPEFKVGYVHEYEDGISFNGFSVGMTLPFFGNRKKTDSSRAQALADEYKAMQAKIQREASVESEYAITLRLYEIYNTLAPIYKIDNNLALLQKAFNGGELSAIEYIREVDFFRSSESTFLEIERDYYLALSNLNKYFL